MTTDPTEYRQVSRDRWSRAAAGWSQRADELQEAAMPVSQWMVDAVHLQPGHTVLELAAGPGITGFLAAELVQPGGRLICTDFAEPMLAVARQRATQAGLHNVDFRVVDAEAIDLDTASVNAVLCRFGYMLMADPGAALGETRRVLRPGGRVALAAWSQPDDNAWAVVPNRELVQRGLVPPQDPEAPGMFAFAQPSRIEQLLGDAGFLDVEVASVDVEMAYDDVDDFLAVTTDCSRPFADAMSELDDGTRNDVRDSIAAAIEPYRADGGRLRVPGRSLVAAASA